MFDSHFDYSFLHTIGCVCFTLLHINERDKFSPRTVKCTFLGYSHSHKGYRCYDSTNRHLRIARHVTFFKNIPYYATQLCHNLIFRFLNLPLPFLLPLLNLHPHLHRLSLASYPLPLLYWCLVHLHLKILYRMSLPPPRIPLQLRSHLRLFHLFRMILLFLVAILHEITNLLLGTDLAWLLVIHLSWYLFLLLYIFYRNLSRTLRLLSIQNGNKEWMNYEFFITPTPVILFLCLMVTNQ